jgi:REP element-mobilizing transposase RayT
MRNEIYAYMAGILKNLECHPIKIGGVEDHVHILSSLSKNIAFSEMISRIKGSSTKRLKEKGVHGFACPIGARVTLLRDLCGLPQSSTTRSAVTLPSRHAGA